MYGKLYFILYFKWHYILNCCQLWNKTWVIIQYVGTATDKCFKSLQWVIKGTWNARKSWVSYFNHFWSVDFFPPKSLKQKNILKKHELPKGALQEQGFLCWNWERLARGALTEIADLLQSMLRNPKQYYETDWVKKIKTIWKLVDLSKCLPRNGQWSK